MNVSSDIAPAQTIAGHAFTVKERAGGVLHLRVALHGGSVAELALRLRALAGVLVTRGPDGLAGCYMAHCAGFKIVLSRDENEDAASALVSPTPIGMTPALPASELSSLLTELTTGGAPRPGDGSPARKGFAFGKPGRSGLPASTPLRRAALAPGKPLSRKTPLARKTPISRLGKKRR